MGMKNQVQVFRLVTLFSVAVSNKYIVHRSFLMSISEISFYFA